MLTALALTLVLQQAAGTVVWNEPPPAPATSPDTPSIATVERTSLPDWAVADPFGWERSQCSPLIRGSVPLETCQARVRSELSAALGDQLPAALRPTGDPLPCQPTQGDNGSFAVQCGTPERQMAAGVTPTIPDCRSRPVRQGGSVAFTTDCRPDNQSGEGGLSFRLFGGGRD